MEMGLIMPTFIEMIFQWAVLRMETDGSSLEILLRVYGVTDLNETVSEGRIGFLFEPQVPKPQAALA